MNMNANVKMNCMNMNQKQLLHHITKVSFALDDVVLFLDTHPCDQDALNYYCQVRDMRKEAVNEYTKRFGPLSDENVDVDCYWDWVKTPWPWE